MPETLRGATVDLLSDLGASLPRGGALAARTPITGETLAELPEHDGPAIDAALHEATEAFAVWRRVPAPRRGELIRLFGEELRAGKAALGRLVSIESGKILSEGLGEVQEMIDICDLAVGLSRQLHGLTIATERAEHRMMETWHPLGVVGIISAFNFPVAVWAWNAALALVCGDPCVWKPSEKTPLAALATQAILARAMARFGDAPPGLSTVVLGGRAAGEALADDRRVALLSATGSTAMGRAVGPRVAARFGRSLLELGGNNAAIVMPTADLGLATRGIAFAAMGTAGQRCTTLRRLFVHHAVADSLLDGLRAAYASAPVGDPLDPTTLIGPLIDGGAFEAMRLALDECDTVEGGERVPTVYPASYYVRPALVRMAAQTGPMLRETFAPILYVTRVGSLDEAIALNNAAAQGLSSAIFTNDLREAERFLAESDCGIANVNIGTSGAEIGGAFGGEKETGGGRESGSDSWRAYMRRATNTLNYGSTLPLAQGVRFDV